MEKNVKQQQKKNKSKSKARNVSKLWRTDRQTEWGEWESCKEQRHMQCGRGMLALKIN